MLSYIDWGSDKEAIHAQYRHSRHRPNYIAVEPVDTEGQLFSKAKPTGFAGGLGNSMEQSRGKNDSQLFLLITWMN